jgi:23S rRNA (guanosine2251-2'-O)-methyltransferase
MAEYIFGYHTIEEMLRRGVSANTLLLSRTSARIDTLRALAQSVGVAVSEVEEGELTRLCGSPAHRGAVLVVQKLKTAAATDLKDWLASFSVETGLVLALDHISDPQNLGTILRSADLFRADLVILPSRRSAQENQTVARVSSGASAYVPLVVLPNIPSALEFLKKNTFWIYGAEMSGNPVHKVDLRGRVCLVMGSEGEGLRRLTRERCDLLVRVPASGHVDSFNVSVAAGILMYEVRRQQGFPY